jgi:hypothetical protein
MGWWLRSLSVAFIVSSVAYGAIFLLRGEHGERLAAEAVRLRPTIDDMVTQGNTALRTLLETSSRKQDAPVEMAQAKPAEPAPQPARASEPEKSPAAAEQDGGSAGQLPYVVIEPKDFGSPAMAQAQVPATKTPELSELKLRQGFGQEPMDLTPVEARLRMRVPQEVMKHFDLFLYVSKATPDKGTWAQTMFVLARTEGSIYELRHSWKVSTGKEEMVMSPSGRLLGTNTPEGMFKLDRWRSFEDYTSRQWRSPMPYAIFFDWQIQGRVSGLALHGSDAKGELELGNRASHGCIRLATENARTLFQLITQNYKGRVPKFQIDPGTGTMSTKGALLRDENGKIVMTSGYKVLVFIEDYGGPANDQIAALF